MKTPQKKSPVFCAGTGKYHTSKPESDKKKPYLPLFFNDFVERAKTPQDTTKQTAHWFMAHNNICNNARSKEGAGRGIFHALVCDFDSGNHSLEAITGLADSLLCNHLIYATKSSKPNDKRWRVIIPLRNGLSCKEYETYQKILQNHASASGITPDLSVIKPNQIHYLPNIGAHYEWARKLSSANFNPVTFFSVELADKEKAEIEAKAKAEKARLIVREKQAGRVLSGALSPIQAYNETMPVRDALLIFGFKSVGGGRFLSPNSSSKNAGVTAKGSKWHSHHASDAEICRGGDSFDLLLHYGCGGNMTVALQQAGRLLINDGSTITDTNQRIYAKNHPTTAPMPDMPPAPPLPEMPEMPDMPPAPPLPKPQDEIIFDSFDEYQQVSVEAGSHGYLDTLTYGQKITGVRAGMGSGKTYQVIKAFCNSDSVLMISHRRALIANLIALANRLLSRDDFVSYEEKDGEELNADNKLAICINSLYKLAGIFFKPYGVIIIDEAEQLMNQLMGDMDKKRLIIVALKELLKGAEKIVLLDADLSPNTVKFFADLAECQPDSVTVNISRMKRGAGREITVTNRISKLLNKIIAAVCNNESFYLATNTRIASVMVNLCVKHVDCDYSRILINGDTSGNNEIIAFLSQPNKEREKYQCCIASPTMGTGVSLDTVNGGAVFDHVFGWFTSDLLVPSDFLQAISRVRGFKSAYCYVEKVDNEIATTAARLTAKMTTTRIVNNRLLDTQENGEIAEYEQQFSDFVLKQIANYAVKRSFVYKGFVSRCQLDGFQVSFDEASKEENKELIKALKKGEKAVYIEKIIVATILKEIEANELTNQNIKDEKEIFQLRRYRVADFFALDPDNKAVVEEYTEWDNRGKGARAVMRLIFAMTPTAAIRAKAKERAQKDNDKPLYKAMQTDINNKMVRRGFDLKLMKFTGCEGLLHSDIRWDKASTKKFTKWVEKQRGVLIGALKLPKPEKLAENPCRYISGWLRDIGLKTKRYGNKDYRSYGVDESELNFVTAILERKRETKNEENRP